MQIKKEDYQRAFSFNNLGYLIIDYALDWYKRRDFLSVFSNGKAVMYISKKALAECSENGKIIFSDKGNFSIFEKGFREATEQAENYIKMAKEKETITIGDFFDLRAIANKMYHYFEKTEFFFTDRCYAEDMDEITKKNLLTLGSDLKVWARPVLVELVTTILYKFSGVVARDNDLDSEDLKFYNFNEIIDLMEHKKVADQSIINERRKSYVIYCENNCIIPLNGDEKLKVIEEFKESTNLTVKEFKGIIANKGKVIGKARVILPELDKDYNLFVKKLLTIPMEKGEILVTETSSPDFMPLIIKAGGIIANQGGLNSHAAIVSREFGIPCLVGTHNATQLLKTGDLIEVDANQGIVRILNK